METLRHMTPPEAADRLGVSRQWVNELVRRGILSEIGRAGRVRLLDPDEVEELAAARARVKGAPA